MNARQRLLSLLNRARVRERLLRFLPGLTRIRRAVQARARGGVASGGALQQRAAFLRASLRLRLSAFFALFLILAWLSAAVLAWLECREYMDEFFDTQQLLFAKRLASANLDSLTAQLPKTRDMLGKGGRSSRGSEDDDALGFAVFTVQGKMILSDGENGSGFLFDPQTRGFTRAMIRDSDDPWRIVWVPSLDGRHVVAVGQELEYREDMVLDMLAGQLLPWSLLLPVLLGGLVWMLSRELAPLRSVAAHLETRSPRDGAPLAADGVPSEARPLITALNALFGRITALLARERAFISDAAHELRTPLAGLRVQAEVARLAGDDPAAREHALARLLTGIDRSSRLVEQLLAISRVEAMQDAMESGQAFAEQTLLHWPALLQGGMGEYGERARRKDITLELSVNVPDSPFSGHPVLMGLLVRNLLDNAVRYTPPGGWIRLSLFAKELVIRNSGPGVDEAHEHRLGERFFRPPGQEEAGSGLGLSMVRRIAAAHRMDFFLRNRPDGGEGFEVRLVFFRASGAPEPARKNSPGW